MLTKELTGVAAQGQYVFLGTYARLAWTIAALAAAVYLWIAHKEIRWKLLFPLLLIMAALCTPPAYKYCFGRYFRLFWILPRGVLTAMAVIDLIRRFKNQWIRLAALVLAGAIIFLTGTSWFNDESVTPAYNAYKIHDELPEICSRMLKENAHPRAVCTGDWAPLMVRQYSADIELLWGRNAYGFTMPIEPEAAAVFQAWNQEPHDWDTLLAYMSENGYDYLCTTNKTNRLKRAAKRNGFKRIITGEQYWLYAKKDRVRNDK